jgi:hypothetical protein
MNMPHPMVVASHLWASMVIESAVSIPARWPRSRSEASAAPPQAASTWYQAPCSRATRAHSVSGSIIPAPVVPAVGEMSTGTTPAARSRFTIASSAATSMRPLPSVSMSLSAARPIPA